MSSVLEGRRDPDTGDYDEERFAKPLAELQHVCKLRDLLMDNVAFNYFDKFLNMSDIQAFAADAEYALRWVRGDRAIQATVHHHVNKVLTKPEWRQICWQIAANEFYLTNGIPLQPDVSLYGNRWMIVDIIGVDYEPPSGAYARLEFRALTGMAAGWTMHQDMSEGQIYYLSGQFGYRGRKSQPWYNFEGDPAYLLGLYFVALIEDMSINRYACTGQLYEVNRKIIRMRYRAPGETEGEAFDQWGEPIDKSKRSQGCPKGYSHECVECKHKRHLVIKPSLLAPRAATCAAGY